MGPEWQTLALIERSDVTLADIPIYYYVLESLPNAV